ncbi:MFS transporter [Streptomyces sp. 3N207]|uniref:MFS transporter n=1 Tax=Streptomyces sp. 3N207 TaxID=3457417 RepID=UPI003FD2FA4E
MDPSAPTTAVTPVTDQPPADPRTVRRAALAGLVGTALEQYDFVIYGTASALVFGDLFFGGSSPAVGILASFGAYAVGFAARPLGGLFFSRYGDRLGRKWVLVATLLLMGGSTLAIGLLPTYAQAGFLAPFLLVLCRMAQGFGAGAEQSGGSTLLTETARKGHRGVLAAMVMTGAALGTALGAAAWALAQLLPDEALMSWGWRLVFASSIFVSIGALIIRRRLQESPVFEELKAQRTEPSSPVSEVLRGGRRPLLLVMLMSTGVSAQSYTYQVFIASYLVTGVGVDADLVPQVLLIGALCGGAAALVTGRLSDRFGRRPVSTAIMSALIVLPAPSFVALNTGSTLAITVVIILGFVFAAHGAVGVQMSYFPELFGSRYRYAGVTLGREFSSVLGGGFAPLICAGLISAFSGSWIPVAAYMMLMGVISLVATRLSPETVDRELTDPADATATATAEKAHI